MEERKNIMMTVFHQGAVIVNDATILRDYGDCLLVSVDLKSTYAKVEGVGYGGNLSVPSVHFTTTEYTIKLNESKDREVHTIIEFPECVGWRVFSYWLSKNNLALTLVSPTAFNPQTPSPDYQSPSPTDTA
jgi:hypothetical protein